MELFIIGLKNLIRNKRRTILNCSAISIGMMVLIIIIGWVRGYFIGFYQSIINFDTGHLQILQKGYMDEERRMPLDISLIQSDAVKAELLKQPWVETAAERIDFYLNLSKGWDQASLLCKAIEPEAEGKLTVIKKQIIQGDYLDKGPGILISKTLAEKWDIKPGDSLRVSAQDKYQTPNILDVVCRGIFYYGYPVLDKALVFMDLTTARELLSMGDSATRIVVRLKPGYSVERSLELTQKWLGPEKEAFHWQRFAQSVVSAVKADSETGYFMVALIYLFTILGIINSMSMSINERTREIGTLRAIGMKGRTIVSMFLYEAIGMALISIVFAFLFVSPLAAYLQTVGFDMSQFIPENLPIPFGQRFTAHFIWYDFAGAALSAVIISLIGSAIPARRISKITISRAMGSSHI
ncbi:MAG: ABC transporter permease [Spirochaetales bacterium]|nr:ABC transporter permease [Spirochaetales bacterium]